MPTLVLETHFKFTKLFSLVLNSLCMIPPLAAVGSFVVIYAKGSCHTYVSYITSVNFLVINVSHKYINVFKNSERTQISATNS